MGSSEIRVSLSVVGNDQFSYIGNRYLRGFAARCAAGLCHADSLATVFAATPQMEA